MSAKGRSESPGDLDTAMMRDKGGERQHFTRHLRYIRSPGKGAYTSRPPQGAGALSPTHLHPTVEKNASGRALEGGALPPRLLYRGMPG